MITTNVNCNLILADYQVCRITASFVLKSVKLDKTSSLSIPVPIVSPTLTTDTPDNLPPLTATSPAIVSTHPTSQPETSGLTQAISTMAISSSTQQQIAIACSQKQLLTPLSAPFSPVANHIHSHHHHPTIAQSSTSPILVQSQAQALPIT
jgi:hypothetical protein